MADRPPASHDHTDFADVWSEHRPYLVDLAFRMLGNIQDAEDVVQEAFSRLLDQDLATIDDARGWLIVVVSRICLDQLRSARHRRETGAAPTEETTTGAATVATGTPLPDPADRVTLDDNIRMALLVVLQQLTPAERAVFVLHDVFQFSFDAVAAIVDRTPAACRQIASRARHRIEAETGPNRFEPDLAEQQRVAQRFIAVCAGGDLDALVELLDPDVGGDVDLGPGLEAEPLHGPTAVGPNLLKFFGPKARVTLVSQPINGNPGVLAFRRGQLVIALQLELRNGLIHEMHAVADPRKLAFLSNQLSVPTA